MNGLEIIHPVEILLTLVVVFTMGVAGMNWLEGLYDRKRIFTNKLLDTDTKEVVNMAVRMDAMMLAFCLVLGVSGIRAIYAPNEEMTQGRVVIFILFCAIAVGMLWVSIKNRNTRWRVLRPTIGIPSRKIIVDEDTTLAQIAQRVEELNAEVQRGATAAQTTASEVKAALGKRTQLADLTEGAPGSAADAAAKTPKVE